MNDMGDLDTQAGMQAQELLDRTAKWTEKIYDYDEDGYNKFLDAHGKDCNKILYIEYSYIQIGKTEQWLQTISAKIGDPLTVRREILLQRLHGSSLSPYPQEDIEYITSVKHAIIDELWLLDYYKFDIYTKLNKNIPYIVGIDCSTGSGGDNNAITILNPYTVEPDAEFECSYIGETKFEMLIKELVRVLPRCVLCIERNSVGDGIIDHLLHSEISTRLYYDKSLNYVEDRDKANSTVTSMLQKQASIKTYYGVYTSSKSRDDMIAILSRHVSEYKEKFKTENIIRDLSRLVRKPNGKVEAGPGFHDDSIMSYLIGLYVYYHGNNLYIFGIDKGARDDELTNNGLYNHEEFADPTLVNTEVIRAKEEEKEKEQMAASVMDWDSMMKTAIANAQRESYTMHKAGVVDNIFNETPEVVVDDYGDGSIDLDFFDNLNGF